MAGGKLTPRQKMINLMYLVFIAMMALNMSKEVLSAFGLMNERLEASNQKATERNQSFLSGLQEKASENAAQYKDLANKAKEIEKLSGDFNTYIQGIKEEMLKGEKDPKDYQVMDKSKFLDERFFISGKLTPQGQEFVNKIGEYREGITKLLGDKYKGIVDDVNAKFSTANVKNREGVEMEWLSYNFEGFPMVASLTKLTQMQADVKAVESEILSAMLQGNLAAQVSMTNYKAIVVLDKNAFYQGESVTGKVVLGRYDENTVPTSVSVNTGNATIENGQAVLKMAAGAVGEHDIKGKFVFMEGGKPVDIPIEGKYVVVPRPNSATISADKMNSIYRGVDNPMTISFAGVSDNNVTANATGLRPAGGGGKYIWRPDGIQGEDAVINVSGKLPDGTTVSDKKTFKVRNIPAPAASIRGKVGGMRGNKQDLINSTVSASFPDFVFDVSVTVVSFEVSVPGSGRMICQGNKFSPQAQAAINKAKKGDDVVISNVKTTIAGSNVKVKDSSPFIWEVQ